MGARNRAGTAKTAPQAQQAEDRRTATRRSVRARTRRGQGARARMRNTVMTKSAKPASSSGATSPLAAFPPITTVPTVPG